ncbi:MAG: hypothetical protein P8171_10365 [Candidatus Thiodiazotropha sp.]|jgi:hypothetical protein
MGNELQTQPASTRSLSYGYSGADTHSSQTNAGLDGFRNSQTTSEQLQSRPTAINQQLSRPGLAQRLGLQDEAQSQTGRSTDEAASVDQDPNADLPEGKPISKEEFSLLKKGDFKGFWRSRFQAGDPVARTALTGWGDPDYVNASTFERLAAQHTWSDLSSYIEDHKLPVTMQQIGLELARAHAQAVMSDDKGAHHLLSPHQVADYHHNVFAQHDIPPHLFGGTHQIGGHWYLPDVSIPAPGGWAPTRFDANTYSGLWCKGCDTKP